MQDITPALAPNCTTSSPKVGSLHFPKIMKNKVTAKVKARYKNSINLYVRLQKAGYITRNGDFSSGSVSYSTFVP